MSIRMIVVDLDGTLLRNDKTISERNLSALRRSREMGIKVVFATARGNSSFKLVPTDCFDGWVRDNGATGHLDGMLIYDRCIAIDACRDFLVSCSCAGIEIILSCNSQYFSNTDRSHIGPPASSGEVVDFREFNQNAERISTFTYDEDRIEFMRRRLPDQLRMVVTSEGFVYITHIEASKSKAVAALADAWGISKDEIVSFGDEVNDIDLLQYSGIAVAMGNAIDEVRRVADFITLSNEDDGIAAWLEHHVISNAMYRWVYHE